MNILILNWRDTKHSWAGGSELFIKELSERWVKMDNKVTLFCGQDFFNKLPDEEVINGVTIIRKGNRFSIYLWAIVYYFKYFRKNTDVILDVENGVPFFSPIYSRKKIICLVYHVHGKQFFYELNFPINYIGYLVEKYIFPIFYRNIKIIAISKSSRNELIKLGFNSLNIKIIVPGVNEFKNSLTNIKKYKKPTIVYLGRIKKYKRVDALIRVFSDVSNVLPGAQLIIAGWGSEAPFLMDTVMRSSNKKKIKILGPVTEREKQIILAKSWIFVNPSLHEGWGISVIETNLYGTPAIAFNVPGLSDSIKNGHSGILVQNEQEMTEQLIKLITDSDYRNFLRKNAMEWSKKFKWETSAKKSMKILLK